MKALGQHLLIELYGCLPSRIDDCEGVRSAMLAAANDASCTIVTDVFHEFSPQGISGVVVIAESHLAIHTWPEHGIASVDVFSCGDTMQPERVGEFLKLAFGAKRVETRAFARGQMPQKKDQRISAQPGLTAKAALIRPT